MTYYRQETMYTCGPACARMVLSHYGITVTEAELATIMKTEPTSGSDYDSFKLVAERYGLSIIDQFGISYIGKSSPSKDTLNYLDALVKNDWIVILAYSLDVPHFSIFTGHNNNHLFLADPLRGEKVAEPIKKFIKKWKVDPKDFRLVCLEYDLIFDETKKSSGWWIALKK